MFLSYKLRSVIAKKWDMKETRARTCRNGEVCKSYGGYLSRYRGTARATANDEEFSRVYTGGSRLGTCDPQFIRKRKLATLVEIIWFARPCLWARKFRLIKYRGSRREVRARFYAFAWHRYPCNPAYDETAFSLVKRERRARARLLCLNEFRNYKVSLLRALCGMVPCACISHCDAAAHTRRSCMRMVVRVLAAYSSLHLIVHFSRASLTCGRVSMYYRFK